MSEIEKLLQNISLEDVKFKKLKSIATIDRGTRVVRNELSNEYVIPVYQNSLTPLGYFNDSNRKAFTTFVISAGAAGQVGFSEVAFWAADDCITVVPNQEVEDKYIYYNLLNNQHCMNLNKHISNHHLSCHSQQYGFLLLRRQQADSIHQNQ